MYKDIKLIIINVLIFLTKKEMKEPVHLFFFPIQVNLCQYLLYV
jgi:hypothetical protein